MNWNGGVWQALIDNFASRNASPAQDDMGVGSYIKSRSLRLNQFDWNQPLNLNRKSTFFQIAVVC